MNNLLKKLKDKKEIVALYTNTERLDTFHVAYIQDICDDKLLELNVGLHGEFDGYSAEYVEAIYRIETKTKYLNALESMLKLDFSQNILFKSEEDLFLQLINLAISKKYISSIYVKNNDNKIVGFIEKHEDNKVFVTQISEYGEYEGETVFFFDDICRIMVNDVEAQELNQLYKQANN